MGFLSRLGLISQVQPAATDWEAKFKTAVIDLEARDRELDDADKRIEALLTEAAERAAWNKEITDKLGKAETEIVALKAYAEIDDRTIKALHEEIAALRPDAEKWRDRAARELQRGQAKRDAAAKKGAGK